MRVLAKNLILDQKDRLSALFARAAGHDIALLVIDVQKRFADPEWRDGGTIITDAIAGKIAAAAPAFRAAGVPVYAVYMPGPKGITPDRAHFHKFKFERGIDIPVPKNKDSAFSGSDIQDHLEARGHRTLILCGFNLSACVMSTALQGRMAGFDIVLLEDLTANGLGNPANVAPDLREMERSGIIVSDLKAIMPLLPER